MAKRTPDNCGIIKRHGKPGKDGDGKCMGFGRAEGDDEPCDSCRRCKYCAGYDNEENRGLTEEGK